MGLPYSNTDYSVKPSNFISNNLLNKANASDARSTLGINHLIPTPAGGDAGKVLSVNSDEDGVEFTTASSGETSIATNGGFKSNHTNTGTAGANGIAIGDYAGQSSQNEGAIAIGY